MSKLNLKIETERLIIRPFVLDDIEPAYEMNLDAEVSKYTGDGGIVNKAEIRRRINEDVFGDYEKYVFETLNLNRLVAFLLPQNLGSIRVLEKLDFQHAKEVIEEGMLVQQYILNKK